MFHFMKGIFFKSILFRRLEQPEQLEQRFLGIYACFFLTSCIGITMPSHKMLLA